MTGRAHAHDAHDEECAGLFAEWLRYYPITQEDAFSLNDQLVAERECEMLARQLRAIGCDPMTLLAVRAQEWDAAEDDDDEDTTAPGA